MNRDTALSRLQLGYEQPWQHDSFAEVRMLKLMDDSLVMALVLPPTPNPKGCDITNPVRAQPTTERGGADGSRIFP